MKETATALYKFFSSFGIPAYQEACVPENAETPYITYSLSNPQWDEIANITASVWYKSTSLKELTEKIDEIEHKVNSDHRIPTADGSVYIYEDNPFSQIQSADNDDVMKVGYLMFIIHAVTK